MRRDTFIRTSTRGQVGEDGPKSTQLLDAAERLFAERGIDSVSVREITAAAGVNLASVNYYFGSKEGLLVAVLKRRLDAMSARRRPILDALEASGQRPTVREVVEAFNQPIVSLFAEDPQAGQSYMTLLARLVQAGADISSGVGGITVLDDYLHFYRLAMPDLSSEAARIRIAIAHSAVLEVMGRPLSDGGPTQLLLDMRTEQLTAPLVDFVVAGLSAPPRAEEMLAHGDERGRASRRARR